MDLKDIEQQMGNALDLLNKTTQGLPERIKELNKVTANEAEILQLGLQKLNNINSDISKEMESIANFLKGK